MAHGSRKKKCRQDAANGPQTHSKRRSHSHSPLCHGIESQPRPKPGKLGAHAASLTVHVHTHMQLTQPTWLARACTNRERNAFNCRPYMNGQNALYTARLYFTLCTARRAPTRSNACRIKQQPEEPPTRHACSLLLAATARQASSLTRRCPLLPTLCSAHGQLPLRRTAATSCSPAALTHAGSIHDAETAN